MIAVSTAPAVLADGRICILPAPATCYTPAGHARALENKRGYAISSASTVEAGGFNTHGGAGRDAVEFILDAKGILDELIERCITRRNTAEENAATSECGEGGA